MSFGYLLAAPDDYAASADRCVVVEAVLARSPAGISPYLDAVTSGSEISRD
jgi:hypothetical protein